MAKPEISAQLPVTLKLTDGARSIGMTPKEFRSLLARLGIEVLRPSIRRERIRQDDLERVCASIAGPALADRQAA